MSSLKELQVLMHEKFGIDLGELTPEASLREKGFDSLALVECLFAIEDHFKISMRDEDSTIDTLGQLAAAGDEIRAQQPA